MKQSWFGVTILVMLVTIISGCGGKKFQEIEPVEVRYERGLEYFEKGKYTKAIKEFTFVTYNSPGGEFGDDAQLYLAECHYNMKEYILAISEYERMLRIHPESPLVEKAGYKRALCYATLSPSYYHDQANTYNAINAYQDFIEDYPTSEFKPIAEEKLDELRYKLAKKLFEAGKQYKKLGEYSSSIIYMKQLLESYYDSEFAPEARWIYAESEIKLKNWVSALSILEGIIDRDDGSEYFEMAKKSLPDVLKKVTEANASADKEASVE